MEKLIIGIEWLADGGRNHARELQTYHDNLNHEQFRYALEEAVEWLKMIVDSEEID